MAKENFSMKELKCEEVVVFTDRAEVKRSVRAKLTKGQNELIITNVPNCVDQDSFRVQGEGNATVLDVVCQTKKISSTTSTTNDKAQELKKEIEELESQKKVLVDKLKRFDKQNSVLDTFAQTLSTEKNGLGGGGATQDKVVSSNSKENVSNFMDFLDSYTSRLEIIDQSKFDLNNEIKKLDEKLSVARANLVRLNPDKLDEVTEVAILLDSAADSIVTLFVSYVVYNASWSPKYDIRVSTREKLIIVNYFGMIIQSTGEDWNETKLSLSTATPSIGGNVPELGTTNVRIKPKPVLRSRKSLCGSLRRARKKLKQKNSQQSIDCESNPQVESTNIGSTATFSIPRSATIPSDNNTHKVSIGVIQLKPQFEYESVPKRTMNAYIKAKVKNTSEYALLSGPANVFFENNFVAKTNLKPCSPTEEFTCSLGVDPAIRIDYKPVKRFTAQSGILSKSTVTTYTQVIEIKNTTQSAIKLLLSDCVPMSNDEKIKVKLLEPSVKDNPIVKLNKSHNLEFDLNIGAGQTQEITIKYNVEHPSDQDVEFF